MFIPIKHGHTTILIGVHAPYPFQCPHCKQLNSVDFLIIGEYFHIYWVPMCPTGKDGYAKCNNCTFKIDSLRYNRLTRDSFKEISKKYKYPYYTYIGVSILSFFFILMVLALSGAFKD